MVAAPWRMMAIEGEEEVALDAGGIAIVVVVGKPVDEHCRFRLESTQQPSPSTRFRLTVECNQQEERAYKVLMAADRIL